MAPSARISKIEPPAISAARLGDLEEVRTWISNAPQGLQNHYVPFEVSDVARNIWTDVNARNEYGNSALHIASSWQKLDIVEYLLSLDQIDLNARNISGGTPLHWACKYGQRKAMKLLVGLSTNQKLGRSLFLNLESTL